MPARTGHKKSSGVKIQVPLDGNLLLEQVLTLVNTNPEILTLWKITNVNAIKRMGKIEIKEAK